MSELMDIDEAIQDSIPTNDESDSEGEEPEDQPEGKEGGEKKEGEEEEEKEGIEGYDDTEKEKAEGDEKTDSESEKTDTDEPPVKKPKKNRYQERIDTMTREKYEREARIAELEDQLNNKSPELPPEPDPAKYTFDRNIQGDMERARDQYNQDLGKWKSEVERINKSYENRDKEKTDRERSAYFEKMSKETSVYGDFETANRTLANVKSTQQIHEALATDEHNTDLFCFLGNPKNSAILDRVLRAKGYQQSRILAEISFKLQYHKNAAQRQPSKAPPPTGKPKGGRSGGSTGTNLDKASFETVSSALAKAENRLNKKWIT